MKRSTKTIIKEYGTIAIGMLFVSIGVYFFMGPANVVLGSITGLAIVLVNFIPIPVSAMTLALNILCLVVGFIFIGREFGSKTVFSSLLLPLYLRIFESALPNMVSLTDDIILDTLCCIVILSIGQAMMFNVNASSGGLDILAKVLNKYLHVELGKGVATIGILTVLASAFVFDIKTVIVGLMGTYFNGIVLDSYIGGFSRRKRVCILTDETDALMDYILHTLERGVTLYDAKGGYGGTTRRELVTILTNSEYGQLVEHIRINFPSSFVTVSTVNEVVGAWNTPIRQKRS